MSLLRLGDRVITRGWVPVAWPTGTTFERPYGRVVSLGESVEVAVTDWKDAPRPTFTAPYAEWEKLP